ncbi:NTP transferase domain-containing protein [Nonomuraea endophytica]|uniref:Molybdopterin-guanine dinucleotide biosynthesis protein A n=1 Tax=Nonomuraea endophytica TaxID=714136 RepID=A0A7W8AE05_9ACTN|nr:NTP transferase domain-containing protein [Nonomuraea endophytica]MBB5084375.1 molybdopterin-guanine dinucleotide biosynthesis protein A [Nonomuraea endophytica]
MVYDAVVLAGGAARRLGGVDKPGLSVGGRSLLEIVAAAVPDAGRLIVVGPERRAPRALYVLEEPRGGGPVPALRVGLAEVRAPWVALLAGDMPLLRPAHVAALHHAASGAGAVLVDDGGREQWLAGVWRADVLREALRGYEGRSLRGLLGPLEPVRVALPGRPWFDCDTMDDLEEAHMNVLSEWTALVCEELGIDPARVDRDLILDLTKEVAHGVARPAAPLTAYLLGLAQGAGTAPEDAVARLTALAGSWTEASRENLTGE